MSDHPFKCASWNTTFPKSIGLKKFRSNVLDAAITFTGSRTINGMGLAHEVENPQDHDNILGVPSARIAYPGDYVNGDAAFMKNQEKDHSAYDHQEKNIPILRTGVILAIPPEILRFGGNQWFHTSPCEHL